MSENGESASKKLRPPIAAMEKGPGPARYQLPSTYGTTNHDVTMHKNPAYSQLGRHPEPKCQNGPGPGGIVLPGNITSKGKVENPTYTMAGRNKDLDNPMKDVPAPNTYNPMESKPSQERKAPVYSMGGKHKYKLGDCVPGPNRYNLPDAIGSKIPDKTSSANYSMRSREKFGSYVPSKETPGPASYGRDCNDKVYRSAPSYSLRKRTTISKNPSDCTPGPGAYDPNAKPTKRSAPKFSMGIRHSQYMMPIICDPCD